MNSFLNYYFLVAVAFVSKPRESPTIIWLNYRNLIKNLTTVMGARGAAGVFGTALSVPSTKLGSLQYT